MTDMKLCKTGEKLKACIDSISDEELKQLEQEVEQLLPHTFSEDFEEKIEKLIQNLKEQSTD